MDKLKEQFERIKNETCSISYLKKGSLSKCYQACGNKSCRCHKDKKYRHGPYWWCSTKEDDKTKSILVPEGMLSEVGSYIDNYKLLKSRIKILEEISEKIIRAKIEDYRRQSKKGR